MTSISRRSVLRGGGLAALAALLPGELLAGCTTPTTASESPTSTSPPSVDVDRGALGVFDARQAAVVVEATARLIPGPTDDPAEAGHPGAREANVVRYIDTMLGALSVSPQVVFAGGPFSNRAGNRVDDMAEFIGLGPAEADAWKSRLAGFTAAYRSGIAALDRLTGGDFAGASDAEKDAALVKDPEGFVSLLFGHAIEGMYSCPEYGGNAGLVGWKDIDFPGDVQPRGYTPDEVSRSDGPDRYVPDPTSEKLLALIASSNEK
jgi:Gluconate 2-dehydrogenase subunit 3